MKKFFSFISNNKKIILLVFLVLSIFITYSQALFNGFFYDDRNLIVENPLVVNHKFLDIWKTDLFETTRGQSQYFRPMVVSLFALEYLISKDNPFFYHLTNIILHILCVLLVWKFSELIFDKLKINKIYAFFPAFLFALHPANSQSVYWIAARGDVLMTMGVIGGILSFRSRQKISYLIFPLAFLLAILSKEVGFLIFILIPLYLLFFREDITKKEIFIKSLILIPIIAVYFVIRFNIVKPGYVFNSEETFWLPEHGHFRRLMTVFPIWGYYLGRSFFPFYLNFESGLEMFSGIFHIQFILGFISVIVTIITFICCRKNKLFLWAFLFYLICLAPVLNVFPIFESGMEHYLYLPLVAFCIFFGQLFKKNKSTILIFVVICIIFSVTIFIRGFAWRTEIEIWKDAAHKTAVYDRHGWIRSRVNLASAYISRGLHNNYQSEDIFKAESLYTEVQNQYPDYKGSNIGLGNIALIKGDYPAALDYISQAVRDHPGNYFLLNKLAYIYSAFGENEQAKQIILEVLQMKPDYDEAKANLAVIYFVEGNIEKSYRQFLNTEVTPRNYEVMEVLNILFSILQGQRLKEYQPQMLKAVDILTQTGMFRQKAQLLSFISSEIPNDSNILYSLSLCYTLELNDPELGLYSFQQGIEKFPNDPRFYKGLGLLYLTLNDTVNSVSVFKQYLAKFPRDSAAVNISNFVKQWEENSN
ncbi:MAG: tetratricopeptide repeat protein [bacterium]